MVTTQATTENQQIKRALVLILLVERQGLIKQAIHFMLAFLVCRGHGRCGQMQMVDMIGHQPERLTKNGFASVAGQRLTARSLQFQTHAAHG